MMNEDYQRTLLMAQLNNKRALKEKYLRQKETAEPSPLTALVMTNVMFLAIRDRVDIFSRIRMLRESAPGESILDTALGWIDALADALERSPYELFVRDEERNEKILRKLLSDLESCDSWENIHMDEAGNGSFSLPGFDYAYRMSEQPSATLLFEKAGTYRLILGDGQQGYIPSQAILWQETDGALKDFIDRVLEELNNGWPVLKEQFQRNRVHLKKEMETLQDLSILLEAAPPGLNISALLTKEAEVLSSILEKERILYDKMSRGMRESGRGKRVKNALLLLGGAIKSIQRMAAAVPDKETLSEVLFLLENAAEPV